MPSASKFNRTTEEIDKLSNTPDKAVDKHYESNDVTKTIQVTPLFFVLT